MSRRRRPRFAFVKRFQVEVWQAVLSACDGRAGVGSARLRLRDAAGDVCGRAKPVTTSPLTLHESETDRSGRNRSFWRWTRTLKEGGRLGGRDLRHASGRLEVRLLWGVSGQLSQRHFLGRFNDRLLRDVNEERKWMILAAPQRRIRRQAGTSRLAAVRRAQFAAIR